jgi:hypothetical protein
MNSTRTGALFLALLPLLAAASIGCKHKAPAPVAQTATAPPLPPSSMTQVPTVPSLPAPAQPQVGPPGSDQKAEETPPTPVRKPHRPKKRLPPDPATMVAAAPASAPVAAAPASAPVAAAVSPPEPTLGQLSAGGGADSRERAAMSEQIHVQEVRLSNLKHPLNDEDEAITKQIESFLSKARQAVAANDLDGAQTLTTKAKVLLDELSRS